MVVMRQKYILYFLIVVIIFMVGRIAIHSMYHTIRNVPSTGSGVIAFGDSLVKGVGSTPGNDFVSVLSNLSGVQIENAGLSGDTTETALTRIDSVLGDKKPQVVIVLLGGNDFIRRVPKAQTFINLKKIIAICQNRGSVVILLGVQDGVIFDGAERDYADLADSTGSILVPNILAGLVGNSLLMSDTIHPNDKGYAIMARNVLPALKEAMQ